MPLVDRVTWDRAQHKRRLGNCPRRSREELISDLRRALAGNPALALADLAGAGCATEIVYRKRFGGFTEALRLAGCDPTAAKSAAIAKLGYRVAIGIRFRCDFVELMTRLLWRNYRHGSHLA